jgi:DUF2934 family protein
MKPRKPRATPRSKRPISRKSPASAASNANAQDPVLYERIAQRAYELYEQRGRLAGYELEDWFQAEREFRSAEMPKQKSREGKLE